MTRDEALMHAPPFLSTKEAAFACLLWLTRQPNCTEHRVRMLCELAELSDWWLDHFLSGLQADAQRRTL
jgi:hypothetical protein